jgi:uncharacterized protein YqgV (UPF0045/DUF77 family)
MPHGLDAGEKAGMNTTQDGLKSIAAAIEEMGRAIDRLGIRLSAVAATDPREILTTIAGELHEGFDLITAALERMAEKP